MEVIEEMELNSRLHEFESYKTVEENLTETNNLKELRLH